MCARSKRASCRHGRQTPKNITFFFPFFFSSFFSSIIFFREDPSAFWHACSEAWVLGGGGMGVGWGGMVCRSSLPKQGSGGVGWKRCRDGGENQTARDSCKSEATVRPAQETLCGAEGEEGREQGRASPALKYPTGSVQPGEWPGQVTAGIKDVIYSSNLPPSDIALSHGRTHLNW